MKKSLIAFLLAAMSTLVLTGCFQPQQTEQQPEAKPEVKEEVVVPPAEELEGGGGVAADETAANYPSIFENEYYGFTAVVPASWGGALINTGMGDEINLYSKKDSAASVMFYTIEPESKSMLEGGDIDEVWLGENSKWAFYYTTDLTLTDEQKEILNSFKAVEPAKYTTVKEKIENIDTYGFDTQQIVVSNCSKEAEALNKSLEGTIKVVTLSEYGSTKFLNVLQSANPDKLTKEELVAIAEPCAELGANQVLKVTDDYILWGYPKCSGGAIPSEGQPGYEDYENCLKVEKELHDYLGLEI